MKIFPRILLSILFLIGSGMASIYAQSPTITHFTTFRSICYNDGKITVTGSGGTGSYIYSLTAGPNFGIPYPIVLPANDTTFLTLEAGTYTVQIRDANGQTSTTTVTVPGTYQFPTLTATQTSQQKCISISAQNGRPPYLYSISTVSAANGFLTYQNSNFFCGLCSGNYWVRVQDSCGNIFTSNRITVSLPNPSPQVRCGKSGLNDSLTVTVPINGQSPPFTFTLSNGVSHVTNRTGVFVIPGSCNVDTIRVVDSCGQSATVISDCHTFIANITSDCSTGSAVVSISGGVPPYIISGTNGSLTTHLTTVSFNSLPVNLAGGGQYTFIITDSCGHRFTETSNCLPANGTGGGATQGSGSSGAGNGSGGGVSAGNDPFFTITCPMDSSMSISGVTGFCQPTTFTCVNCTPPQSVIVTAGTSLPIKAFRGLDTGTVYHIHVQDTCGSSFNTNYKPHYNQLRFYAPVFIACNSFILHPVRNDSLPMDITFYVYTSQGTLLLTTTDTAFYHLPSDHYTIVATLPSCISDTIPITLPHFSGQCIVPMYDSSCHQAYAIFQVGPRYNESLYLVNDSTHVSYGEVLPYPGNIYFNNVVPGSYHLVSDSGCSIAGIIPPHTNYRLTLSAYVNCSGQPVIQASESPWPQLCTSPFGFKFSLFHNGVLYQELVSNNNTPVIFSPTDTGLFTVRMYFNNVQNFGVLSAQYDTVCPVDVQVVYSTRSSLPSLVAQTMQVCHTGLANIPYVIYGGSVPYTVQILGYPTRTLNTNRDTFPGVAAGVYSFIVSDACGISRSFSVSVIDTCSIACSTQSVFAMSGNVVCRNDTVHLINQSIGSSRYQWKINGNLYGSNTDTFFVPSALGSYSVWLYAYRGNCTDSLSQTLTVISRPILDLGADTSLCAPVHLILNTHIKNTIWPSGPNDSLFTVNAQGIYIAQLNSACGVVKDTIQVFQRSSPIVALRRDTNLCPGQSIHLNVPLDSSTFLWSTGSTDSVIDISSPVTNPVRMTVTRNGCSATAQIRVNFISPPSPFSLGHDTTVCGNISLTLSAPDTAVWSTAQRGPSIHITSGGLYFAVISNACGSVRDSITITQNPIPIVNLGSDTSICTGDSLRLSASIDSSTFLWSTGATDSSIVVSSPITNPIRVTVIRNGCSVTAQINVNFISAPLAFSLGPDTFFCDQIIYTLSAPDTAVWSTNVRINSIVVTAPGIYIATIRNNCGVQSDTVNINLKHSPLFDLTADKVMVCEGEPDTAMIQALLNAGQTAVIFRWSTGAVDSLVMQSAIVVYQAGTYHVTASNSDCSLTKDITINAVPCDSQCFRNLVMPDIFSPNGDTKNDTFRALHICDFDPYILHIYNRWGQKVFESHVINQGWDGRYHGEPQPEGAYTWWTCATIPSKQITQCRMGTVTLVR